jgi:hypothetical protein
MRVALKDGDTDCGRTMEEYTFPIVKDLIVIEADRVIQAGG